MLLPSSTLLSRYISRYTIISASISLRIGVTFFCSYNWCNSCSPYGPLIVLLLFADKAGLTVLDNGVLQLFK